MTPEDAGWLGAVQVGEALEEGGVQRGRLRRRGLRGHTSEPELPLTQGLEMMQRRWGGNLSADRGPDSTTSN